MSSRKPIIDYFPERLFNKCPTSNTYQWFQIWDLMMNEVCDFLERLVFNFHLPTMELDWVEYWEEVLRITPDPTDTIEIRKSRLFVDPGYSTQFFVKTYLTSVGFDYDDIIIRPRRVFNPSFDATNNYTFDIVILPVIIGFDGSFVRQRIQDIVQPSRILGAIVNAEDFWEWDNALLPLDDVRYVTNMYPMVNHGGFELDHVVPETGTESPDGNFIHLKSFLDASIESMAMYCYPFSGMQVQFQGHANINLAGFAFNVNPNIISPVLTDYNGIQLIYARIDPGPIIVIEAAPDTLFTPGVPDTYDDVLPGTDIVPIAELTTITGQTVIIESDIIDVRSIF